MSNDETTDERFDMFLRDAAQEYNRPPASGLVSGSGPVIYEGVFRFGA